jgi:hypothetical protein
MGLNISTGNTWMTRKLFLSSRIHLDGVKMTFQSDKVNHLNAIRKLTFDFKSFSLKWDLECIHKSHLSHFD